MSASAHMILGSLFARHAPDDWTADDCRDAARDVIDELDKAGFRIIRFIQEKTVPFTIDPS